MTAPGVAESLVIRLPPTSSQEAAPLASRAARAAEAPDPPPASAATLSDSSLPRSAMVEVCGDTVCAVQVPAGHSNLPLSPKAPSPALILFPVPHMCASVRAAQACTASLRHPVFRDPYHPALWLEDAQELACRILKLSQNCCRLLCPHAHLMYRLVRREGWGPTSPSCPCKGAVRQRCPGRLGGPAAPAHRRLKYRI